MTHPKTSQGTKNARSKTGGARAKKPTNGAAVQADFREILERLAETKERGVFEQKDNPRVAMKHSATNTPDTLFARIVAGAKTEDHQLRALEAAASKEVPLPAAVFVIGEPVVAAAIIYSGHARAGLSLMCMRGQRHFSVGLADAVFPSGSHGARFVSLYRAWLGLGEQTKDLDLASPAPSNRNDVASEDITVGSGVELVVLSCKSNALRCRLLGEDRELTLRTAVRDEVPGEIITVVSTKQWTRAHHTYIAGNVLSSRGDVDALDLIPLALRDEGEWDPEDQYWGEEEEPVDEWAKPIIAHGKRPMFEMEQVVPGVDPEDFDSDPIVEASELNAAGDRAAARGILMSLLAQDLRCLDAHAHLGNFEIDRRPAQALRHYNVGISIGALSLDRKRLDVLPWGLIDNRPFLRCLLGAGLCWWRLGKAREAAALFRTMLWLNPGDNQGARFNLAAVEIGKTWDEMEGADG